MKKVTISLDEYIELRKQEVTLGLLEAGGVDNWDGYDESLNPDYENYDDIMNEVERHVKFQIDEIERSK